MNKKNAITWMKALAALLVVNSHMAALYPSKLKALAFGGLFGNILFVFISGYCLSRIKLSFPRWCVKRLTRIYIPYVLFIPFLYLLGRLNTSPWWNVIFPVHGYHFIASIITLYPIYYFLAWLNDRKKILFKYQLIIIIAANLALSLLGSDKLSITNHYCIQELSFYLVAMILGGMVSKGELLCGRVIAVIGFVVSFATYTVMSFMSLPAVFTLLKWYSSLGFSYFGVCALLSIDEKLPNIPIVNVISDLTLDMYLVQFAVIDIFSAVKFPAGYILCMISVIAIAYCLSFVSSLIVNLINKRLELQKNK